MAMQTSHAHDPADRIADRSPWSAAQERVGGVELRDGLAGREDDRHGAPDQETTQGHDE